MCLIFKRSFAKLVLQKNRCPCQKEQTCQNNLRPTFRGHRCYSLELNNSCDFGFFTPLAQFRLLQLLSKQPVQQHGLQQAVRPLGGCRGAVSRERRGSWVCGEFSKCSAKLNVYGSKQLRVQLPGSEGGSSAGLPRPHQALPSPPSPAFS